MEDSVAKKADEKKKAKQARRKKNELLKKKLVRAKQFADRWQKALQKAHQKQNKGNKHNTKCNALTPVRTKIDRKERIRIGKEKEARRISDKKYNRDMRAMNRTIWFYPEKAVPVT
jgi:hypothetical protein